LANSQKRDHQTGTGNIVNEVREADSEEEEKVETPLCTHYYLKS